MFDPERVEQLLLEFVVELQLFEFLVIEQQLFQQLVFVQFQFQFQFVIELVRRQWLRCGIASCDRHRQLQ